MIEYLKTPPSRDELKEMIARAGLTVREAIREKGGVGRNEVAVREVLETDLRVQAPRLSEVGADAHEILKGEVRRHLNQNGSQFGA